MSSIIQQNIQQNQEDFTLNLNSQPEIFKKGFFTKVLDLPQVNKEDFRTCTIYCNYKNCK
jgi:hypothetical protein